VYYQILCLECLPLADARLQSLAKVFHSVNCQWLGKAAQIRCGLGSEIVLASVATCDTQHCSSKVDWG